MTGLDATNVSLLDEFGPSSPIEGSETTRYYGSPELALPASANPRGKAESHCMPSNRRLSLRVSLAECDRLIDGGEIEAAEALIARLCIDHPNSAGLLLRRGALAAASNDVGAAVDALFESGPPPLGVLSKVHALLIEAGLDTAPLLEAINDQSPSELVAFKQRRQPRPKRVERNNRLAALTRAQSQNAALRARPNKRSAGHLLDLASQTSATYALKSLLDDLTSGGRYDVTRSLIQVFQDGTAASLANQVVERRLQTHAAFRSPREDRWAAALAAAASNDVEPLSHLAGSIKRSKQFGEQVIARPKSTATRLGVLGYSNSPSGVSSNNLGDPIQTVAFLANVARFRAASTHSGPLAGFVETLHDRMPPDLHLNHDVDFELIEVARDALVAEPSEQPLFVPLFGWFMHPIDTGEFLFPPVGPIEAIPIAIHIAEQGLLDQNGAVEYLKEIGPVGCRDWTTVEICAARGISAFFAGCTTSTLSLLAPGEREPVGTVAIDVPERILAVLNEDPATKISRILTQVVPDMEATELALLLYRALDRIDLMQASSCVHTSRLHCYLPTLAVGGQTQMIFPRLNDFTQPSGDIRFDGLVPITPAELSQMSTTLTDLYAETLLAVAEAKSVAEFRNRWRSMTANLVNDAQAELARRRRALTVTAFATSRHRPPTQSKTATARRTVADLAFAFDKGFEEVSTVAIFSALESCSVPVALHLLVRGVDRALIERITQPFDVEIHWHECESEYGNARLVRHIGSASTLDRLHLPSILPNVDQVIYLDADLVVLKDVSELLDMRRPNDRVAARLTPLRHPPLHDQFKRRSRDLPLEAGKNFRTWIAASEQDHSATSFNAGVVVMDLSGFRADRFEDSIEALGEFGLHDQDLLNIYAASSCTPLAVSWNATPSDAHEDPAILHYVGPKKPWGFPSLPASRYWHDAADRMRLRTGLDLPDLRRR